MPMPGAMSMLVRGTLKRLCSQPAAFHHSPVRTSMLMTLLNRWRNESEGS